MVAIDGIDHSSLNPGGKIIKALGFNFVARYISPSTTNHPYKQLTLKEINDLRTNQLDVVTIWETIATRSLEGFNAGISDAKQALAISHELRLPWPRPIFFCGQDADWPPSEFSKIIQYFKGINTIIDKRWVGNYSGYHVMKLLFDEDLISYGWQTPSWSRINGITQWDPRIHIKQFQSISHPGSTLYINGVQCDTDLAIKTDYGQWFYKGDDMSYLDWPQPAKDALLNDIAAKLNKRWNIGGLTLSEFLGPNVGFKKQLEELKIVNKEEIKAAKIEIISKLGTINTVDIDSAETAKLFIEWLKQQVSK